MYETTTTCDLSERDHVTTVIDFKCPRDSNLTMEVSLTAFMFDTIKFTLNEYNLVTFVARTTFGIPIARMHLRLPLVYTRSVSL